MKIRKLKLINIGVFDKEEIDFKPIPAKDKAEIHIFTGQNGSGKTTILMALASAFDYVEKDNFKVLSNDFHKRFRNQELQSSLFQVDFDKDYGFKVIDKEPFAELATLLDSQAPNKFYNHQWYSKLANTEKKSVSRIIEQKIWSFSFAVFAFSGYRQVKSERIEAIKEPPNFNPLYQSLEFIKNYSELEQITINQLIANNISKSAIERNRDKFKSEKFASVVNSIEQAISEITGWKIEFDLQTEPTNLIVNVNGAELDFDVLPDGLRSLISWIADLLGRVDLLKWQDDLPIFEKNLILFLDEIEVHLHPAWQRKVLPVVQKLFKNSQIFISTHSPFVINSVDDAWVYKLELENGKARVAEVVKSEDGHSYSYVLSEIFDIKEEFGIEVQKDLAKFKELRNKILASNNGSEKSEKELLKLAKSLAVQSEELQTIIQFELRQINKRTGKSLTI